MLRGTLHVRAATMFCHFAAFWADRCNAAPPNERLGHTRLSKVLPCLLLPISASEALDLAIFRMSQRNLDPTLCELQFRM